MTPNDDWRRVATAEQMSALTRTVDPTVAHIARVQDYWLGGKDHFEADRIVSILIEFEGGGTAELNAAALEAKVRVDYPIDDVVLGRPVSSTYRYIVTVIRANGRQERDAVPRESSSATFFVNVVLVFVPVLESASW